MKVGKKIRMRSARNHDDIDTILYTIVEIFESSVKVKHPRIGGHFTFSKKNIVEVIDDSD